MDIFVGSIVTTGTKLGISRTGKPLYRFRPLCPSLPLPPCRVVYGGEQRGRLLVVCRCRTTTPGQEEKEQVVELVYVIGVADRRALLPSLQYMYGVNRKPFRPSLKKEERSVPRLDCTHLSVFSVDPLGCIDIDDAFSIERLPDGTVRFGVHIAQPVAFLSRDEIQERAQRAFSTLYCDFDPSAVQPLWGPDIEHASSLLQGEERPAYSVFFTLSKEKRVPTATWWGPTRVINRLATHYDDTDSPDVQDLLDTTPTAQGDTHEAVAFWMLETNKHIGSVMEGLPCRVQPSQTPTTTTTLENTIEVKDGAVEEAFDRLSVERASYSVAPGDDHHASLGVSRYVHFTSPIRRMMDAMVHYQITYDDTWDWPSFLDGLNRLDQGTKRFHRACRLVRAVDALFIDKDELPMTGYLYEKMERGLWRLYFKELDGFVKVRVVAPEMLHLFSEQEEEAFVRGQALPFMVYHKKSGFLPVERLVFIPGFLAKEGI
jgi:hypothetical protein